MIELRPTPIGRVEIEEMAIVRQRLAAGGDLAIVEAHARFITATAVLSRQLASMIQTGMPLPVGVLDAMQILVVGFSYEAFRDAVPSITFTGDSNALWEICNAYQSSVWPEWLESTLPEVLRYRKRLEDACKTGRVTFSKIAEIPAEVLALAGENGIEVETRQIQVGGRE